MKISTSLPIWYEAKHLWNFFSFSCLQCFWKHFTLYFKTLVKENSTGPKCVTCAKARDTKPRFNTSPNWYCNLSQEHNPNQPVWNFLINADEVIGHVGPLYTPQKEAICMIKNLCCSFPLKRWCPSLKIILFPLLWAPLPHLSSYKNLPFIKPLGALF